MKFKKKKRNENWNLFKLQFFKFYLHFWKVLSGRGKSSVMKS